MITQAIILAGGLGTRLRSAVPDLPKCMAPVAGKPFIDHVINYFISQGIKEFILALGYKSEVIIDHIDTHFPSLAVQYSIETDLLGTGGAIRLACEKATSADVLVLNGDSILKIDLGELSAQHEKEKADCTLSLKPMENFERYGVVTIDVNQSVRSFMEKRFYENGLINGGVYALNVAAFHKELLPAKFSFEKDYLEALTAQRAFYGLIQDGYFIDIGIPEDYARAQTDFAENTLDRS